MRLEAYASLAKAYEKQEWTHEPIPPLTKKHQRRNFFSKAKQPHWTKQKMSKNWRFDSSEAGIAGKPRVTNWSQPHGTHGPNSCRRIFSYSSFNSADLRSGASRTGRSAIKLHIYFVCNCLPYCFVRDFRSTPHIIVSLESLKQLFSNSE
ncbi:MAG: hypothetical protein CM15mP49_21420 [Actinomycetota bacterium]|nr:MAG: hypothetical protein CM15mP49_21420 [Actinomycetota bacterium]